jgi:hypothetical protein
MNFRETQPDTAPSGVLDVNADLRVRNIWVTSVVVTMGIRARNAVLLHLRQGLEG